MNHYTQLLIYLKELFEKDPLVNVVTQDTEDDYDKMTVFPVVNIDITGAGFTNGGSVILKVSIQALDLRDINKKINTDKFWGNDNRADIMNETLAVLNRAWTSLYRDLKREGITVSEGADPVPIKNKGKQILDGWEISFDVTMPNRELSLCQYN